MFLFDDYVPLPASPQLRLSSFPREGILARLAGEGLVPSGLGVRNISA